MIHIDRTRALEPLEADESVGCRRDAGNIPERSVTNERSRRIWRAPAQIVTLTMNPALDITTSVDVVRPTEKLRCGTTRYDPGGGGINVARIAHVLGGSVSAVFPAGGATGDLITTLLVDAGVRFREVAIAASTRESFTVNETSSGQQYRFVLPGPQLTFPEQERCLGQLRMEAAAAEFVVASGSLPPACPLTSISGLPHVCRDVGARPDSGHLGRWPATDLLRGVSPQSERARTARMRGSRTRHRGRATGRRTRTHRQRTCRSRGGVVGISWCATCHTSTEAIDFRRSRWPVGAALGPATRWLPRSR